MLSLKNLKISQKASTSPLKRFIQGHPDANGTVRMSYLGLLSSLLFYSFQTWEDALFLDTWIHLELKSMWVKPEHLSSWKLAEFSSKWASYSMRNIRSAEHTGKTGSGFSPSTQGLDQVHSCALQTLKTHQKDLEIKVGPSKEKQRLLQSQVTSGLMLSSRRWCGPEVKWNGYKWSAQRHYKSLHQHWNTCRAAEGQAPDTVLAEGTEAPMKPH